MRFLLDHDVPDDIAYVLIALGSPTLARRDPCALSSGLPAAVANVSKMCSNSLATGADGSKKTLDVRATAAGDEARAHGASDAAADGAGSVADSFATARAAPTAPCAPASAARISSPNGRGWFLPGVHPQPRPLGEDDVAQAIPSPRRLPTTPARC